MQIHLHPLKLSHATQLFQLVQDSRDHLEPWLPSIKEANTPETWEYFLLSRKYGYSYPEVFVYEVWVEQDLCGLIYVHSGNEEEKRVELSYWLGKSYTGQGIMTEACELLLHRLFGTTTVERVLIRCHISNVRSRGIPQRLGFKLNRSTDESDVFSYALSKKQWLKKHPFSFLFATYPQVV